YRAVFSPREVSFDKTKSSGLVWSFRLKRFAKR
ncbi:MAG: hypothetical protein PWP31_1913, partial [Clostridia bacterium]|nr:hypothetical protein [Clostridia bacterium]